MFPAPNYSYAPQDDDLDLDFSQFELRPGQETSNPLFIENDVPPPPLLQNGISSGSRRQPLPTTWSPLPGRSPLPPQQPMRQNQPPPANFLPPTQPLARNHLPQSSRSQGAFAESNGPPSPCESVSDRITAMMLAPPDLPPRLPGPGPNVGPYYVGAPGREQPSTQMKYRQEVPPQLQPYPPAAAAMPNRHAEQYPHPHPLSLDRTMMEPSRYPPSSGYYNTQPPPPHRVYSPPPTQSQDYLPPQQTQQDLSPTRHLSRPADYQNVPSPLMLPVGHETRYPYQNSPRDFGHMMPMNNVPPNAINPLETTGYYPPPPQRQEYVLPPQVQNDRVPPRQVSDPTAYRTAPRPPTPPLGHEARHLPQEDRLQAQRQPVQNQQYTGSPNHEDPFPPRDHGFRRTLPANATRPQEPLSSPEQKPRSRSFRENRSQQQREERSRTISTPASRPLEKIREFAPHNPKAPSIPLPDYEGEAVCDYVPKPDYGDDLVTAYVPRPDYMS